MAKIGCGSAKSSNEFDFLRSPCTIFVPKSGEDIRKLKHILRTTVAIVATVTLLAYTLLSLPAVQDALLRSITQVIEEQLGTKVHIRHISLQGGNRIVLGGIRLYDTQGRTLLHASRLAARMELLPLLQSRISISSLQLYGFHANLYQATAGQPANFQFLIDALKGDGGESAPIQLNINTILLRHGRISWHRRYKPRTPMRFNANHVEVNGLSLTASLRHYSPDSLNLSIRRIEMSEASGLQLQRLSFNAAAGLHGIWVDDFLLELPHTHIALTPIAVSYTTATNAQGERQYRDLRYEASTQLCTIHPADLTPLVPQLVPWPDEADLQLNAAIQGDELQANLHTFQVSALHGALQCSLPLTADHPLNAEHRSIHTSQASIHISPVAYHSLAHLLPPSLPKGMGQMFPAHLQVEGSYTRLQARGHAQLSTAIGRTEAQAAVSANGEGNIKVQLNDCNLGTLLDMPHLLGTATAQLQARGIMKDWKPTQGQAVATIPHIGIKGHQYESIKATAQYRKAQLQASLQCNDPLAHLYGTAQYQTQGRTKLLNTQVTLHNLEPHRLNLTTAHPHTAFSACLKADLQGTTAEDLTGQVALTDFCMTDSVQAYSPGPITVTATHLSEGQRLVELHSNFLEVSATAPYRIRGVAAQVATIAHACLPSLVKAPPSTSTPPTAMSLHATLTDATPLRRIVGIPLYTTGTLQAHATYNDITQQLQASVSAPWLEYSGQQFTRLNLTAHSQADLVSAQTSFTRTVGKSDIDFHASVSAANDSLHAAARWNNSGPHRYDGEIRTFTTFSKESPDALLATLHILPTGVTVNDSLWSIHPATIQLGQHTAQIQHFKIEQQNRFLTLNGRIGPLPADTLDLRLNDINLEYVFNIVDFHAVDFTGMATGTATGTSLTQQPNLSAQLHVKDFRFNTALLGNMNVTAGWDRQQNAITLLANIHDYPNQSHTNVQGSIRTGAPPHGGLDLLVNTRHIDLAFLNKYTSGFFSHLNGRASGWTRIAGPFKDINLEGDMCIDHATIGVASTNVEYRIYGDSVILRPDLISIPSARIYDAQGSPGKTQHSALVRGNLRHTSLSNLRFNFDIEADNILGYDQKDFGDNVFCGTAYATGQVGLRGKPGQVDIDIDATPQEHTQFVYNQSSPTTVSGTEFITYVDHHNTDSASTTSHTEAAEPTTDMRINFLLNLTPKASIKILMDPKAGDYISLAGNGRIRANYYNKGNFSMFGTYTVDHGVYKLSVQDVIRKDFTFNPGGTLVFGGPPMLADLNLQAVYTVPSVSLNDLSARSTFSQNNVRVNCLMNLGGKAQAPQISFDFDLPNVNEDEKQMVRSLISTEEERNMQVIYLLGIGRFYTYDYTNNGQSQSSVAMKSLLSSTLSAQLNQMFSTILGTGSNWNIGTNLSTGEVGWSDMDVEGLLSGRLLNNRLLINGNFGYRDNSAMGTGNFIGDFDIQWILTQSGNVSLKAYSKTNDRYFTKSSLTTQGVGIALKRDFGSWRDVFRIFVPRKRRKTQ